jgi:hypothetical protein
MSGKRGGAFSRREDSRDENLSTLLTPAPKTKDIADEDDSYREV